MNDTVAWFTDDAILDASTDMYARFNAMYEHTLPDAWRAATQAADRHLNCVLALDPAKINEEYERIYDVAMRIGANERAIGQIDLTRDHLVAWRGKAADAFRLQLTYMRTFCDTEKDLILEGLRGVAAAYAIAVEGRAGYLGLVQAAAAAAGNVRDNQKSKETEARITIMGDLVEGIVTLDPKSLLKTASATVVNVVKDAVPVLLDDSGADQVCDSYRREGERLCQSLGYAYDHVQRSFAHQRDKTLEPPQLYEPMPAYCDVESPDFTYEHFKNTVHDPGPIGPRVEAERQKYAEEKKSHDSEIGRRLNHGDKGAG